VGLSRAVQIEGAVLRIRERPIGLGAPAIDAHHEQGNRWLLVHTVVQVFQPAVEPAQMDAGQVERAGAGRWAELALRETAGEVGVTPRANDQALVLAGAFGAATLAHALVVLERGRQEG